MDLRVQFIGDALSGLWSVTDLANDYAISRKTAHKWLARYRAQGAGGLTERSRRPHHSPAAMASETADAVLAVRRRHPHWGPRKIVADLRKRHPRRAWPSPSAVSALVKRHGLVAPRRRRSPVPRSPSGLTLPRYANAVWTTDYKGKFRTRDHRYCYPLTLRDGCSRFVLLCDGMRQPTTAAARASFERAFATYGLPECIRSDNGTPFAGTGLARLSRLSIWWIRLGIRPERIALARPDQNGSHEQFHRVLKAETARPPAANLAQQQRRFDDFCRTYNTERPHEALNYRTPRECYTPSPRPWPVRLPPLIYPGHFEVRRVSQPGAISWGGRFLFLTEALIGEDVGLEEVDDGLWIVYFGPVRLARFDERRRTLRPVPSTGA
jgi:transposase InsO family protein